MTTPPRLYIIRDITSSPLLIVANAVLTQAAAPNLQLGGKLQISRSAHAAHQCRCYISEPLEKFISSHAILLYGN